MITPTQERELKILLAAAREKEFYFWTAWRHKREAVLRLDRYECQLCKAHGRYARATIVHHVKHLRDRPDLALSVYDPDTGVRQLISVCKRCHMAEHPESLPTRPLPPPLTEERWD